MKPQGLLGRIKEAFQMWVRKLLGEDQPVPPTNEWAKTRADKSHFKANGGLDNDQ